MTLSRAGLLELQKNMYKYLRKDRFRIFIIYLYLFAAIEIFLIGSALLDPNFSLLRYFVAVALALFSICVLFAIIYIEMLERQDQAGRVIAYIEGLRQYAVGNIEPLRESVKALQLLDISLPPEDSSLSRTVDEDRPLGTKERNILLAIIGVLCKSQGIDISKPAKAAGAIKNLTALAGLNIGETTIEQHLKRITEAYEARSK